MKPRWSRLLAAAALGNLWMFPTWTSLLTYTAQDEFFMQQPPGKEQYVGAILSTLVLTLAFWAAMELIDFLRDGAMKRAAQFCFLLTLPVALNTLREAIAISHQQMRGELLKILPPKILILVAALVVGLFLLFALCWTARFYRVVITVLVVLSPMAAVTLGGGLLKLARASERFPEPPHLSRLRRSPQSTGPRVVWIIFDGLDERIAFEDRPKDLDLPELDAFRHESLFAPNAQAPGISTLPSVTSLLTGRRVAAAERSGPDSAKLRFAGGADLQQLSDSATVFSEAQRDGYASAVVGWYFPYCRVIGAQTSSCEWMAQPMKYNSYGSSLAEIVPNQLRGVFESSVLSIWGHTLTSRHQARIIKAIQTQAEKAAASGEFDLVYLHLPAPHPPHVFDRRSGKFNLSNQPIRGYTDSLALTDLTLGRLHEVMRDAGLWDTSTVIVTSDHFSSDAVLFDGKRSSRVPFMVKLPGQRSEVVYSRPVETIISKSLVLSILKGSISTPEQLVGFLETASTQR